MSTYVYGKMMAKYFIHNLCSLVLLNLRVVYSRILQTVV